MVPSAISFSNACFRSAFRPNAAAAFRFNATNQCRWRCRVISLMVLAVVDMESMLLRIVSIEAWKHLKYPSGLSLITHPQLGQMYRLTGMAFFAKSNRLSTNPCPHNFGLLHLGQQSGLGHGNSRSKFKRRLISMGTDIIMVWSFWGFFNKNPGWWEWQRLPGKRWLSFPSKIKWASTEAHLIR